MQGHTGQTGRLCQLHERGSSSGLLSHGCGDLGARRSRVTTTSSSSEAVMPSTTCTHKVYFLIMQIIQGSAGGL